MPTPRVQRLLVRTHEPPALFFRPRRPRARPASSGGRLPARQACRHDVAPGHASPPQPCCASCDAHGPWPHQTLLLPVPRAPIVAEDFRPVHAPQQLEGRIHRRPQQQEAPRRGLGRGSRRDEQVVDRIAEHGRGWCVDPVWPDVLGDEAPGASRLVLSTEKLSGDLFEVLRPAWTPPTVKRYWKCSVPSRGNQVYSRDTTLILVVHLRSASPERPPLLR